MRFRQGRIQHTVNKIITGRNGMRENGKSLMPSTPQDLDLLHDLELLGRCLLESIDLKLGEYGLDWDKALAFTIFFSTKSYLKKFRDFDQFVPVRW